MGRKLFSLFLLLLPFTVNAQTLRFGSRVTNLSQVFQIIEKQTDIMKQSVAELKQLLEYIGETKQSLTAIGTHNVKVTEAKGILVNTISSLSSIADSNATASEETTASMEELNANVNMLNDSIEKMHELADNLDKNMKFFTV